MKTTAVVLEAFDKPLTIREFDVPELRPREVLVEIAAAEVCGSELHICRGGDPRVPLPLIPGHEGVGRERGHHSRLGARFLGMTRHFGGSAGRQLEGRSHA